MVYPDNRRYLGSLDGGFFFLLPLNDFIVKPQEMKLPWAFLLGVSLLCGSDLANGGTADSSGQEVPLLPTPVDSPARISFVEENVTFSPHRDDRDYLNGTNLSYTTGSLKKNSIWNSPASWLGDSTFLFQRPSDKTDNRLEWTILGQSIYTPENHQLRDPSLDDRPYAGWLYTGLNFVQDYDAQQLTTLQFLGGIVGPWALGREVQNGVHTILGQQLARGWSHQLSNEFGFTVSWKRKWRFNHQLGEEYSWEIIPDAGIAVGNVFDYAEAGFLVRWGRGLKADWGPEMVRPGYSGTSYFSGDRAGPKFGWDLFFGTQARAVAWNIFLDGNTLQNSRGVAKEPLVDDLIIGAELFSIAGFRLSFSLVERTPEFRTQKGMDSFGSFNGAYAF
jgi:lipid A 3-O-deacylase